jgi:uncharacterized protein YgiM (DUF1202 family)
MIKLLWKSSVWFAILLTGLSAQGCKAKDKVVESKDLPDLNQQIKPFVTTENTRVRTGPGPQFRAIAQIRQNAKVNVVGRDGEWLLIVSKVGNAPGYIEAVAVRPATGEEKESTTPPAEGQYEATVDTRVRSGPGIGHGVVADLRKGTTFDVVGEDQGWLKVESKRGNPPGYVDANDARPVTAPKSAGR